MAEISIPVTL